ncbi:Lactate utilization protein A [Halioglobus japonicus]|nr:Lactate utilization protein A [Halioglobus japonicus]
MHVELHPRFSKSQQGQSAKALAAACVHCGFCLTNCPTYLDKRDERDSPRGRIYLIKQLLETGEATEQTQLHLDRCLTCRNCETSCPSGMQYGELLDIGRGLMEQEAPRPALSRAFRWLLRNILTRPQLLSPALRLGQTVRPALPGFLRQKIPPRQTGARSTTQTPLQDHPRKMLVLEGCVQQAATPSTNAIARRVLDKLGVSLISAPRAGCCGAVNYHLAAHDDGLNDIRRNIDAWWPYIESGAEAIVSSATGCGAMLVDYARLLAADPVYAEKARRVTELTRDLAEILADEELEKLEINTRVGKIAVHPPCTMQHALQQPTLLDTLLRRAGFEISTITGKLLCCGSAGTYSILQPATSERVREKMLDALTGDEPALIATANIGCQLHLQAAAGVPVVHWIELLDSP